MTTPHSLDDLRRWTDSGGLWELVEAHSDRVVLDLISCTGGEVVGRIDSDDPDLVAFVRSDPAR